MQAVLGKMPASSTDSESSRQRECVDLAWLYKGFFLARKISKNNYRSIRLSLWQFLLCWIA
jgi:hypothetical protein